MYLIKQSRSKHFLN